MRSPTIFLAALIYFWTSTATATQTDPSPQPIPVVSPSTEAQSKPIALAFHRPLAVGARHRIQTSARVEEAWDVSISLVAGQAPIAFDHDRDFGLELDAVREVLAVDFDGLPTRERYTIQRCNRTSKYGNTKAMVPPGAVLEVARSLNGTLQIALASGTLSRKAQESLELLLDVHFGEDGEQIFGPARLGQSGESWELDSTAIAQKLMRSGLWVSPANVRAVARLVGANQTVGVPAFDLTVELDVHDITLPGAGGTEGAKVRARFYGTFPVDPALQPLRQLIETEEEGLASANDEASGFTSGIGLKRRVALSRSIQPW